MLNQLKDRTYNWVNERHPPINICICIAILSDVYSVCIRIHNADLRIYISWTNVLQKKISIYTYTYIYIYIYIYTCTKIRDIVRETRQKPCSFSLACIRVPWPIIYQHGKKTARNDFMFISQKGINKSLSYTCHKWHPVDWPSLVCLQGRMIRQCTQILPSSRRMESLCNSVEGVLLHKNLLINKLPYDCCLIVLIHKMISHFFSQNEYSTK